MCKAMDQPLSSIIKLVKRYGTRSLSSEANVPLRYWNYGEEIKKTKPITRFCKRNLSPHWWVDKWNLESIVSKPSKFADIPWNWKEQVRVNTTESFRLQKPLVIVDRPRLDSPWLYAACILLMFSYKDMKRNKEIRQKTLDRPTHLMWTKRER